jgi:hypothetical protein
MEKTGVPVAKARGRLDANVRGRACQSCQESLRAAQRDNLASLACTDRQR